MEMGSYQNRSHGSWYFKPPEPALTEVGVSLATLETNIASLSLSRGSTATGRMGRPNFNHSSWCRELSSLLGAGRAVAELRPLTLPGDSDAAQG